MTEPLVTWPDGASSVIAAAVMRRYARGWAEQTRAGFSMSLSLPIREVALSVMTGPLAGRDFLVGRWAQSNRRGDFSTFLIYRCVIITALIVASLLLGCSWLSLSRAIARQSSLIQQGHPATGLPGLASTR